jgi:ornithine cyclodeaminase
MQILKLEEIKRRLEKVDIIPAIERGFVAYSCGTASIPPVGELQLDKGEVHIKYGAIDASPYYVIKIASGFYGNPELGLPSSGGCMLAFCQETGQLKSILLDEGHLTDVRTAVAGAIVAKYLAPQRVSRIGIVGTGIQARAQLSYLRSVVDCRKVVVWGRSQSRLDRYVSDVAEIDADFRVETTPDVAELQERCNLIVTTTPATTPLLHGPLRPGTHVTAVGSDTPEKQELDLSILEQAARVVADSVEQCRLRGEISHALRDRRIPVDRIVELGRIIDGRADGRTDDDQITVADLTGVAVQDIQIASAVISERAPA